MQSSNKPGKISVPFASSGAKQPIPVASQQGIEDGRASFTDGFPPLTRTPLAAGGKPPFGTDMNGILFAMTSIEQWVSAGGAFAYDAAFSAAIGGYPKGAYLMKADLSGFWLSTVENNASNPDTGGAGWTDQSGGRVLRTTVYRRSGGVQTISVDGATPTTTNATVFTPMPGATKRRRRGVGGGGGGGGCATTGPSTLSAAGGGGGGSGAESFGPNATAPETVTVGVGGTAGQANTGSNAGNGGSTSVGTDFTCPGGSGSQSQSTPQSAAGVFGGTGPGAAPTGANLIAYRGAPGTYGMNFAGVSASVIGGKGGDSIFGVGPSGSNNTAPGVTSANPGTGGSGAAATTSGAGQIGGAGADGMVIIEEYA